MKRLKKLWCHVFHRISPPQPGGYYLCWDCQAKYPVPWGDFEPEPEPERGFGVLSAEEVIG